MLLNFSHVTKSSARKCTKCFQLNIRSMDDYIDQRLQNAAYFENLLKNKEIEQNDENREIVNAHAKWREEDEGKLEYIFISLYTHCSIGPDYSLSLKTGSELSLEEMELMYMILESNMKEKDEQHGKEWNAVNERECLFFY